MYQMYCPWWSHLLHVVAWPDKGTYTDLCDDYITYVSNNFDENVMIIFDGYDSNSSTKVAEQERRAKKNVSPDILFEPNWKLTTKKTSFLNNITNKDRLIKLLTIRFEANNVGVKQCTAYRQWDMSSCSGCWKRYQSVGNACCIGWGRYECGHVFSWAPMQLYTISEIQAVFPHVKQHLLFIHAFTGCDTVSSIFGLGKKSALALLEEDITADIYAWVSLCGVLHNLFWSRHWFYTW